MSELGSRGSSSRWRSFRLAATVLASTAAVACAAHPQTVGVVDRAPLELPAVSASWVQREAELLRALDRRAADTAAVDAMLRVGDAGQRARGILAIGQLKLRARYAVLRQTLGDPDTAVAANAAYALGLTRDSMAVPALQQAVDSASTSTAAEAAWALGEIGEPARGALLTLLGSAPGMRRQRPAETHAALLLSLAKLRPVPIAPVIAALGEQERSVVRAAAYVVGRNRVPEGVRAVLTVRTHPDEEVRASVARALTKTTVGDSLDLAARMALQQLLRDGNERVRANAARSAATFREQLAEDVLMRMWDPAANVRVAAAEVAAEAFGRDTIRWKRAWNADTLLRVRRVLLEQARALNLGLFPGVERQWATRTDWRYRAAAMGADQAPQSGVAIDVSVARTLLTDPDPRVRRIASQRVGTMPRDTTSLPVERDRPLAEYEALVRRAWAPGERPLVATVTTGYGVITVELFPRDAPLVVEAFQRLAQSGRYDNIVFHRVVPNFVAQAGDVTPDGSGRAEFRLRESYSRRRHGRGCLGLATSGPDTGGSQFYFCHASQPHLDGAYTVFGRVIRGLEVMDRVVQGDNVTRVVVP